MSIWIQPKNQAVLINISQHWLVLPWNQPWILNVKILPTGFLRRTFPNFVYHHGTYQPTNVLKINYGAMEPTNQPWILEIKILTPDLWNLPTVPVMQFILKSRDFHARFPGMTALIFKWPVKSFQKVRIALVPWFMAS